MQSHPSQETLHRTTPTTSLEMSLYVCKLNVNWRHTKIPPPLILRQNCHNWHHLYQVSITLLLLSKWSLIILHLGKPTQVGYILLGKGVWWKKIGNESIEFFDAESHPNFKSEGPSLHHFCSTNFEKEVNYLKKCWKKCMENKHQIHRTSNSVTYPRLWWKHGTDQKYN